LRIDESSVNNPTNENETADKKFPFNLLASLLFKLINLVSLIIFIMSILYMSKTIIKSSNIHGLGLFSLTDIERNSKIADYYGEEMSYKDFLNQYGTYKQNCLNTYRLRRTHKILVAKQEPYKSQNLVNFINEDYHNPNCILKRRALYALRDIKSNEELTLRYPKDYNRYWSKDRKT
jgi:SET domain-containing protein